MAAFQISITDLDGEKSVVADGTEITITDYSNYDTNTDAATALALFNYKVIKFTNPDTTTYTFATDGTGDELIEAPATATLPTPTVYTYETGDGVYEVQLFAVPDWDVDISYLSASNHHVIYNGVIYKAKANSTGDIPDESPSKWEVVELDDLIGTAYGLEYTFATTCDIQDCYEQTIVSALCGLNSGFCKVDLCKNTDYKKAMTLKLILESVPVLVDNSNWTKVENAINLGKQICCCNG